MRKKAPALDAPKVGRFGAELKRLFLTVGEMERMVRKNWRGTEGQRKRGGAAKGAGDGLGGMLIDDWEVLVMKMDMECFGLRKAHAKPAF